MSNKVTYLAAWYRFLPWIRNFCVVIVGLSVMPAFITGNLSFFTGWVKLVIMLAVLLTGITLIVQCEVETRRKSTNNENIKKHVWINQMRVTEMNIFFMCLIGILSSVFVFKHMSYFYRSVFLLISGAVMIITVTPVTLPFSLTVSFHALLNESDPTLKMQAFVGVVLFMAGVLYVLRGMFFSDKPKELKE